MDINAMKKLLNTCLAILILFLFIRVQMIQGSSVSGSYNAKFGGVTDGGGNPAYVDVVTANFYGPGTTGIEVTHGLSLSNGDVLYAFCGQGEDGGPNWSSAGWTLVASLFSGSGNDRAGGVLRKVITDAGGEPASYTYVTDNGGLDSLVVVIVQISDADTSTPEDATATTSAGINDFTPDNVDITTSTTGALVLIAHMAAGISTEGANAIAGAPSGYTLAGSDVRQASSYSIFVEVAYDEETTSGPQTIGSWTGTGDPDTDVQEYLTFAVAVKPQ